ncbi:Fur family transcriptional regulator [Plantactinospora sp. WMMB782]|uniref:Fur family transcriptional regulator n=1 Tax=Plantactinospora sp. WMMB782 TaxID=3404121 RepID=UPI003B959DAB
MMSIHQRRGPDQQRELIGELRAAGLAPTAQRRLVLDALHGHDHPASAIAIYQRLRADGQAVGLTTVYRTLHALADAGRVHVFHRDGELTYRHCRDGPHHHLVCEVCGLVVERSGDTVTRWLQQVRADEDFVPNPQHSDLYGVCGTCLRADRRAPGDGR